MDVITLQHIQNQLDNELQRELNRLSRTTIHERSIQRASIPVYGLDPITWLNAQSFVTKIFWGHRDHVKKIAGAGAVHHIITDSLDIMRLMRNNLEHSHPHIRYFGGMRFDITQPIDLMWLPFAKFRFTIPRFELITTETEQALAINFLVRPETDYAELYKELKQALDKLQLAEPLSEQVLPHLMSRTQNPLENEWVDMVQSALYAIESQEFDKIVLSSKSILEFAEEINPLDLLQQILKKNGRSFHFAFQFQNGYAFIGMTPECLFQRHGDRLYSEAIASTRQRGATPEEDEALQQEMRLSDKDLREHRWVKKMILDRLQPFCQSIETTANETVLKLSHVQHLFSQFSAELKPSVYNEQLLKALHPTPAVGGYPKQKAIQRIAQLEPFDRGWYAAPVGWVSRDEAEFAVAIRSALVHKNNLHIFAGSGIVQGSDPQKEWEENRNKAQNFLQLFERA